MSGLWPACQLNVIILVAKDEAVRHARRNSDREDTRIEHDMALQTVMTAIMKDHAQLFKRYWDNADFRRWLSDSVSS